MRKLKFNVLMILVICMIISSIPVYAKSKSNKWSKAKATLYAKCNIIIYDNPKDKVSNYYDTYIRGDKVKIIGQNKKWYKVKKDGYTGYIKKNSKGLTKKKVKHYSGSKLNSYAGSVYGPSGRETYYNLDMGGVIYFMRLKGYSYKKYPYWVRKDGAKMFGKYVMVAANLNIRPKGTILPCSLGQAIVVDTGEFAYYNSTMLDVATAW